MECRLFLDYDSSPYLAEQWFLYSPKRDIWETNKELIRMEIRRLRLLCPKLGKAVIQRTSDKGNYQVRFKSCDLTREEMEALMIESLSHRGHVYFSLLIGDSTLRVSGKKKSKIPAPIYEEVV